LDELEKDEVGDLDIGNMLRRCQWVFDTLYEAGEESRETLWDQLGGFVAVEEPAFVTLASDCVRLHIAIPNEAAISAIVAAFANRLLEESSGDPTEGFEVFERGRILIEIVTKRLDDLQPSCEQPLSDLIGRWSQNSSVSQLAAALLTPIFRKFASTGNRIIANWSDRMLSDLPDSSVDWLAVNFACLSDHNRHQIIARIASLYQTDNIAPQQAKRYEQFTHSLSKESLATAEIKSHLDKMLAHIRQRHNNPNDYLRRLFSAIPPVLVSASPEQLGPTLNELFANTKGDPALFGWLHEQMGDYWPEPCSQMPQYAPERVFSDALDVATRHPSQTTMRGPLRTMTTLVRRGMVSAQRAKDVVDTACRLWRYHRDQALQTLSTVDAASTRKPVADMIDGVNPADKESIDSLQEAYKKIAARMDLDTRAGVAFDLLSKPATGTQDEPDLCLGLWITSKSEDAILLLESLLAADSLNDDQRRRVWLLIERAPGLEPELFARLLPNVAGRNDSPRCLSEMLRYERQISATATTEQQRYSLGQGIVKAFRVSSSQEAKNGLAAWLKRLNVEGVLKELLNYGEMSDDEIAVLDLHFGKSKQWKKVKQK
jgi:hypothetical protein